MLVTFLLSSCASEYGKCDFNNNQVVVTNKGKSCE